MQSKAPLQYHLPLLSESALEITLMIYSNLNSTQHKSSYQKVQIRET